MGFTTKKWKMPCSFGLNGKPTEDERLNYSKENRCKPAMAKICITRYTVRKTCWAMRLARKILRRVDGFYDTICRVVEAFFTVQPLERKIGSCHSSSSVRTVGQRILAMLPSVTAVGHRLLKPSRSSTIRN